MHYQFRTDRMNKLIFKTKSNKHKIRQIRPLLSLFASNLIISLNLIFFYHWIREQIKTFKILLMIQLYVAINYLNIASVAEIRSNWFPHFSLKLKKHKKSFSLFSFSKVFDKIAVKQCPALVYHSNNNALIQQNSNPCIEYYTESYMSVNRSHCVRTIFKFENSKKKLQSQTNFLLGMCELLISIINCGN